MYIQSLDCPELRQKIPVYLPVPNVNAIQGRQISEFYPVLQFAIVQLKVNPIR
jgi:hypothetical protein